MAGRVENQLLLHQLYRTCNGDLPDIFKKKKCKGNITTSKRQLSIFLLFHFSFARFIGAFYRQERRFAEFASILPH